VGAILTLLRHPRPRVAEGICYGRTDCAADADHEQELLDELLAARPPQRVLASPAQRCRGLAERLCARWQLPCEIEPRLELDAWARQPVDYAPGGGESLREMDARVRGWAHEAAVARRDVLAISHGGVMRLLTAWSRGAPLAAVLNIPAPGFGQLLRFPLEGFAAP